MLTHLRQHCRRNSAVSFHEQSNLLPKTEDPRYLEIIGNLGESGDKFRLLIGNRPTYIAEDSSPAVNRHGVHARSTLLKRHRDQKKIVKTGTGRFLNRAVSEC